MNKRKHQKESMDPNS